MATVPFNRKRPSALDICRIRWRSAICVAAGTSPAAVVLGDVSSDGEPDLAVANNHDDTVSVLLGNGNGTFQAQQTFATGNMPYSATLGYVNGDGKLDLVVTNSGSDNVS